MLVDADRHLLILHIVAHLQAGLFVDHQVQLANDAAAQDKEQAVWLLVAAFDFYSRDARVSQLFAWRFVDVFAVEVDPLQDLPPHGVDALARIKVSPEDVS